MGIVVAIERTLWILPLVALGAVLVPVYNLELLGGRVHTDLGFALAWGAFPLLTAFVAACDGCSGGGSSSGSAGMCKGTLFKF